MKRGGGRGWKWNVCWKETRERRLMDGSFSFQFSHLENVNASNVVGLFYFLFFEEFYFQFLFRMSGWCFIDVKKFGMVCLKVTECLF